MAIVSKLAEGARLPQSVKLALFFFLLAGALVAAVFPGVVHASNHTVRPPFELFVATGLAMVVLTSLLFTFLATLGLGFGKTALSLALGYNVVIGLIKLSLSPFALYLSNQHSSFNTQIGNPNTAYYYLIAAALVLILYVFVFRLIYRHFLKRMQARQGKATPAKRHLLSRKRVIPLLAIVAVAVASGGSILILPLVAFGPSVTYLGYIFGALAIPIGLALLVAFFLAYHSFAAVERQVIVTKNTTLLASFFWLGLSLILLYHIMWVVLMFTLVNLWPFRTYTPK